MYIKFGVYLASSLAKNFLGPTLLALKNGGLNDISTSGAPFTDMDSL